MTHANFIPETRWYMLVHVQTGCFLRVFNVLIYWEG
jgi:hypothetical protein